MTKLYYCGKIIMIIIRDIFIFQFSWQTLFVFWISHFSNAREVFLLSLFNFPGVWHCLVISLQQPSHISSSSGDQILQKPCPERQCVSRAKLLPMLQVVHILICLMKLIWRRAWTGSDEMFGFSFNTNYQMTSLMPVKGNQPEEPSGKDFLPLENL